MGAPRRRRTPARVVLAAAVALAAGCASREAGTLDDTGGELPERVYIEGAGVFMTIDATSGRPGVVAHQLPRSADAVWAAMPAAFDEAGLRGAGVMDPERRIFGYPDAVLPRRPAGRRLSEFLDCGSGPGAALADTYRVTGSVVAAVRPEGEGESVVEVVIEAVAKPRDVSGNAIRCNSNGRLERLISYAALMQAVGG